MGEIVEVLVPGGRATPGQPLGPALGPLGINVKAVVDEINRKTADFNGMQVPVRIEVDDKKQFTVSVGTPRPPPSSRRRRGSRRARPHPARSWRGTCRSRQLSGSPA